MLPNWVFKAGWGTPGFYEYLQLRMETAQMGTSRSEVRKSRKALNNAVADRKRPRDPQNLRWAIKTPVPEGPAGVGWGDLYLANEMAASLRRLGQTVRVDFRNDVIHRDSSDDDVLLVMRGVERIRPQHGAINLLWVISHPSRVSKHELKSFDAVFAASTWWSEYSSKKFGMKVSPLLYGTNAEKFNPNLCSPDSGDEILFLGNTRNEFRQIIKDCIEVGIKPSIYGKGWKQFVARDLIKGEFIPYDQIGKSYRAAGVVLNDHWPDMAKNGFYTSRLFDAVASGARVISDDAVGLQEVFGDSLVVYQNPDHLAELCSSANRNIWGSQEKIVNRAIEFGEKNSFDQRAKVLVQAALANL